MDKFTFEPVKKRKWPAAMRFLIAGSCGGSWVDRQARSFLGQISAQRNLRTHLWWARKGWRCAAAAMVYESPGRTGLLFASPASAQGVEETALVELVKALSAEAIGGGLSLVQSLLVPENREQAELLLKAGYERLAELRYMRLELSGGVLYITDDPQLTWRTAEEFDERELAAVIEATYEDSQDCPALAGVRRIEDTIAGHRNSGLYTPGTWWIVSVGGEAAGCLLLNDYPALDSAEVVYLGVVKGMRGRGVGRAMLCRAISAARSRGMAAVTLAMDSQNARAVKLYESAGFLATSSRLAMVLTWRKLAGGE